MEEVEPLLTYTKPTSHVQISQQKHAREDKLLWVLTANAHKVRHSPINNAVRDSNHNKVAYSVVRLEILLAYAYAHKIIRLSPMVPDVSIVNNHHHNA